MLLVRGMCEGRVWSGCRAGVELVWGRYAGLGRKAVVRVDVWGCVEPV